MSLLQGTRQLGRTGQNILEDAAAVMEMNVVIAVCGKGNYLDQAVRLGKSLIMTSGHFSSSQSHTGVWYFADQEAKPLLERHVADWKGLLQQRPAAKNLSLHVMDATAVPGHNDLFRPCASLWMHAPEVLPKSAKEFVVLGSDQLVVDSLELLWQNALQGGWNQNKLMGVTEESVGGGGWYHLYSQNRFGDNGLNSGGALMSAVNMRRYNYTAWSEQAVKKWGGTLELGDQDVLNRYAIQFPHRLVLLQCNMNIRTDSHCNIDAKPPVILHGNRQAFVQRPEWKRVADRVDELFEDFKAGNAKLQGKSVWEALGAEAREGLASTIKQPWSETPEGPEAALAMAPNSGARPIEEWPKD